MTNKIPSDEEVVAVLRSLGERVTARVLCNALVNKGHPVRQSQVAIQRAAERRRIHVGKDWTLSIPREVVAA